MSLHHLQQTVPYIAVIFIGSNCLVPCRSGSFVAYQKSFHLVVKCVEPYTYCTCTLLEVHYRSVVVVVAGVCLENVQFCMFTVLTRYLLSGCFLLFVSVYGHLVEVIRKRK